MNVKGKKITVVGIGNSGFNAAILLAENGAKVRATDSGSSSDTKNTARLLKEKGVDVEIGGHTEDFVKGSELIVTSPGVGYYSPALKFTEKYKIPVIGEMELGFMFCKGRIIAITGTNGKTTVTTLIGAMLKNGGLDTVVCGNIGNSLCGEIKRISKETWVALEVSSFQLETIESFRPDIAVILNITDDHMDRYSKFEDYFKEKLKIFKNQEKEDILILNYDAGNLRSLKDRTRSKVLFYSRISTVNGACLKGDSIFALSSDGVKKMICQTSDIKLRGLHNEENVLAASLAASIAGVSPESIRKTVMDFKGLRHRFETVDIIDGVEYIDDSKGTTVDSTRRALDSCEKPVILIAGGKDKYSDYGSIKDKIAEKVKELILIGEAKAAIAEALNGVSSTHRAESLEEAVDMARDMAREGDIVMLSPMCSSFDMFKSYKHRGEVFRSAVEKIRNSRQEAKR